MVASDERRQLSKWTVACAECILWARFVDGAAIYDARSGQTHFLTPYAAKALDLLMLGSLTESELSEAVPRALGLVPESDTADMTKESLELFRGLGLMKLVET